MGKHGGHPTKRWARIWIHHSKSSNNHLRHKKSRLDISDLVEVLDLGLLEMSKHSKR